MKWPEQFSFVTVVDNETGEETTGKVLEFTRDRIVIRSVEEFKGSGKLAIQTTTIFDAMKVHFKGEE